jgi:hypothetical protein
MLADTSLNPIYLSKRKLALRLTVWETGYKADQ